MNQIRNGDGILETNSVSPVELRALGSDIVGLLESKGCHSHLWSLFHDMTVPVEVLVQEISKGRLELMQYLGLVFEEDGGLRSGLRIHFVGGQVIFTDPDFGDIFNFPPMAVDPLWNADKLRRLLVRHSGGIALDLGTGAGVLALEMSRFADQVIATDINPRAINFAKFNADLNGVRNIDFRLGDLFEPVGGLKFDTVAFNSPTGKEGREGRHWLLSGESILHNFFRNIGAYLTPQGVALINLGMTDFGSDKFEGRLRTWIGESTHSCNVMLLILKRFSLSPDRRWSRGLAFASQGTGRYASVRLNYMRMGAGMERSDRSGTLKLMLRNFSELNVEGRLEGCNILLAPGASIETSERRIRLRAEGFSDLRISMRGMPLSLIHLLEQLGRGATIPAEKLIRIAGENVPRELVEKLLRTAALRGLVCLT